MTVANLTYGYQTEKRLTNYGPKGFGLSLIEKLEQNHVVNEKGCWLWTRVLVDGYGQIWVPPKMEMVHRVAYELFVGPIPASMVTVEENETRKQSKDVFRLKTHCVHGHEYTEENTWRNAKGARWCKTCNRLKHRARRG